MSGSTSQKPGPTPSKGAGSVRRRVEPLWTRWVAALRAGWEKALESRPLWLVVFVLAGTWSLAPRRALPGAVIAPGAVADRTWVADRDLRVEDHATTEAVRRAAREEVLPVYDLDSGVPAERRRQLAEVFRLGREALTGLQLRRADSGKDDEGLEAAWREGLEKRIAAATTVQLPPKLLDDLVARSFATDLEDRLAGVLGRVFAQGVVGDKDLLLEQRVEGILVRRLPSGETTVELDVYRYLDFPEQVQQTVEQEVRTWTDLPTGVRSRLAAYLTAAIAPNLTLNSSETRALEEKAAAAAGVVSHSYRKGEVIVRKRERIDELTSRVLGELHGERDVQKIVLQLLGGLLFLVGVAALPWVASRREGRPDRSRDRLLGEQLLLLTLHLLAVRFGLFLAEAVANAITREPFASVESYLFAVPFAALPLAGALLYGRRQAVVVALACALPIGPLAGGERMWLLTAFALAGSLAAVFAIDPVQFKARSMLARAGLIVGGVNVAAVVALRSFAGELSGLSALGFDVLCGLVGGVLAGAAVSFAIPILESLLSITTHIKLIELANPNLPLLRRLAFEAPGTFQHSLAVANLAKSGCDAIDRDAVLVHTCALYHDIGKISRPRYFVENQVPGQNPHDRVQPTMSALILINHVKEGLEMARRAGLPGPVLDGIEQHHGTRLIKFFYARARERCDPETEEVREEEFRYPGPKPRNKEMGILMLADAVEAASRTLIEPSQQKLRGLVRTIFDDCLQDRQLDQTDLTLGDLRQVEEAFVRVLTRVYHRRIDYPGFDFNKVEGERRKRRDDSGVRRAG